MALFAALSYAVTKSGRGSGAIDKEKLELQAAQFISYMGEIQAAFLRMSLTGTSPENIQVLTAPNTPCTTGTDCLFAPEGGGVVWRGPPSSMIPLSNENNHCADWGVDDRFYYFPDESFVEGVGTPAGPESILLFLCIAPEACNAINRRIGLPTTNDLAFNQPFDFINNPTFTLDSITGAAFGCFREEADFPTIYGYYHVLYAR